MVSWKKCDASRRGIDVWLVTMQKESGEEQTALLKEIRGDNDSELNRLLRRMLKTKVVGHSPYICKYEHVMIYERYLCVYYPNFSLASSVSSKAELSVEDVMKMYRDVLRGLEHLHQSNEHHGALCPFSISCNSENYVITDAGMDNRVPAHFKPPESVASKAADIWSLSATTFFLLVKNAKQHTLRDLSTRLSSKQFIATVEKMLQSEGHSTEHGTLGYLVVNGLNPDPTKRFVTNDLCDLMGRFA
eukprot:TRINITY_DN2122_c2_g2_i1.p1 TRINITY_DN2122_c2_g2~~TRINITY_DN2122_c2_g2_i1.p1  ORF type:complete len:281 (+),score=42.07 TRINITY_DN2122_c2_g2_i1:107-844(+)